MTETEVGDITVSSCKSGCGGLWLDEWELRQQDKAKMEKTRRIADIFKYICPSYYLPGKQDWGAF